MDKRKKERRKKARKKARKKKYEKMKSDTNELKRNLQKEKGMTLR